MRGKCFQIIFERLNIGYFQTGMIFYNKSIPQNRPSTNLKWSHAMNPRFSFVKLALKCHAHYRPNLGLSVITEN